jgi:hypothetical protein
MVVEAAGDRSLTGQSYRLGAGDPKCGLGQFRRRTAVMMI